MNNYILYIYNYIKFRNKIILFKMYKMEVMVFVFFGSKIRVVFEMLKRLVCLFMFFLCLIYMLKVFTLFLIFFCV